MLFSAVKEYCENRLRFEVKTVSFVAAFLLEQRNL